MATGWTGQVSNPGGDKIFFSSKKIFRSALQPKEPRNQFVRGIVPGAKAAEAAIKMSEDPLYYFMECKGATLLFHLPDTHSNTQ